MNRILLTLTLASATVSVNAAMITQPVQLKNRTALEFMEEIRMRPLQEGFTAILDPTAATVLRLSGEEKQFPRILERITAWDKPLRRYMVTFEVAHKNVKDPASATTVAIEGKPSSVKVGASNGVSYGFQATIKPNQRGVSTSVEIQLGEMTATLPFQITTDNTVLTFIRRDVEAMPWIYMTIEDPATGKKRNAQVPFEVWGPFVDTKITIRLSTVPA